MHSSQHLLSLLWMQFWFLNNAFLTKILFFGQYYYLIDFEVLNALDSAEEETPGEKTNEKVAAEEGPDEEAKGCPREEKG